MTNWLIKLCQSSPRELDRLNRGFPAPSHPDEETDRGGTRKKVLPCRRKSVSLHPESMANFPPLHPAQLGFVAFHMGNEWLVGRAHETEPGIGRIIDVDFSKCFPYVFQMLCDILVISMCFIPPPGVQKSGRLITLFVIWPLPLLLSIGNVLLTFAAFHINIGCCFGFSNTG